MDNLTLEDPKDVDGEPYEVARFAGKQAEEVLEAAQATLEWFRWAARGAWMSAEYHLHGEMPKGEAFDRTPVGQKTSRVYDTVADALKQQRTLTTAASWNPKEA